MPTVPIQGAAGKSPRVAVHHPAVDAVVVVDVGRLRGVHLLLLLLEGRAIVSHRAAESEEPHSRTS